MLTYFFVNMGNLRICCSLVAIILALSVIGDKCRLTWCWGPFQISRSDPERQG